MFGNHIRGNDCIRGWRSHGSRCEKREDGEVSHVWWDEGAFKVI